MTNNPEVSYDAEMPAEARARFEAFMETLVATPEVMRKILDTYPTNDELVEAAQSANPNTEPGKALSLFGQVIENGDEAYVNPNAAFHREIDRIFDRAEMYSNTVDRPRTWFDVLVRQAQNAKIAATTGRIPIAPVEAAAPQPPAKTTAAAAVKPTEIKPAPKAATPAAMAEVAPADDKPVEIRLEPPTGRLHHATPAILFMETPER